MVLKAEGQFRPRYGGGTLLLSYLESPTTRNPKDPFLEKSYLLIG